MKRRLHKNVYPDSQTRHFLLITQNDSKPFPIQRPLKAIPTAKVLKLLDKLYSNAKPLDRIYSHNDRQSMNLKYDIFDPTYSSKNRKVMTKSRYRKFKTQVHRKSHKMHQKANILSTDKHQKQTSDKQQFFLRNGISSRAGESRNSKNRAYHQNRWHNENANKKHIIKNIQSKDMKKNKFGNKTTIDIKSALDEYYSYFLKHIQPFWKHGNKKLNSTITKSSMKMQKQSDDKSLKTVQVTNNTRPKLDAVNHSKSIIQSNFSKEGDNATFKNENVKNSTIEQSPEKEKTRQGTLINLIESSKAVNSTVIDMKPISFKSLESIDSGDYRVYRFSKNNILINLQSKTGELRTFYGKSSVNAKRKTKPKHVSKLQKHSTPEKHLHHHGETVSKQKVHHITNHTAGISRPPKLVDNLKYFQSSLQEEPGYTRSFKERNEQEQQGQEVSVFDSHVHAGSSSLNTNLTAYDVYDNRLAHVEKQRQYFRNDKPDPDRLIITENSDPYTDSNTIKLFVNAGDENSLMPAEPAGLSSHKGESKNLLSDISDDLSKKGNWDKYLDNSAKDGRSSYNVLAKNSESMPRKNGKGLNSEEQDSGRAKSSKSVLRKIVEEEANSIHGSEKSVHKLNQSSNEKGQHDKEERNVTKIDDYNRQISAKYKTDDSSNERSSNTSKAASTSDLTNASFSHERKLKHKDTEGDRKGATADEVWIFRPNPSKSSYKENYSTYSEDNKGSLKETGKAKFSLDSRLKSEQTDSKIKGETGGSEGLMLSRINQELGMYFTLNVLRNGQIIEVYSLLGY